MQAHRHYDDPSPVSGYPEADADSELLLMLGTLREELESMGKDMRELARENQDLRAEASRLRRSRASEQPSDVARLRRDRRSAIDELRALIQDRRETAERASEPAEPRDSWSARRPFSDERFAFRAPRADVAARDDRARRMMMFMMLAEMM